MLISVLSFSEIHVMCHLYNNFYLGWVTPVKNQLSCGSCAAFAITGVHETCMLMAGARFNGLDLSEQQLLDCGYNKG